MLIPRELLSAVLPACSTDDDRGRYFLGAVQIEPTGRLSATNGHVLLTATQDRPLPDAEFPIVPGAEFHGNPERPVLVPADVATRLIKATPARTTLPVLSHLQLSQNGSPETATLAVTDLQTPTVATLKHDADRTFPDIDRVLTPAAGFGDTVEVTIGVPVLEAFIKSAKALAGGRKGTPHGVTFQIPIDEKGRQRISPKGEYALPEDPYTLGAVIGPIPVSMANADGMTVSGVIMPMRK